LVFRGTLSEIRGRAVLFYVAQAEARATESARIGWMIAA
jgi:hypothetical protein